MASSSSSFEKTLAVQLRLVGNGLLNAPSSVDQLLILLDNAEDILVNMEQEPSDFLLDALLPVMKGLIAEVLFKHCNEDVRVTVASCLSEILRITSPEQPFNDDQMKAIFQLIVEALSKLSQPLTRSYEKALSILETVARVKACLLMLDLECEALVLLMCQHFWVFIRSNPSADEYWAVERIMADIFAESDDISPDLLIPLLASVLKENEKVAPSCWKLGEKLISDCAAKLRPILRGALKSKGTTLDDYSPVVALLYQNESTAEHNDTSGSPKQGIADYLDSKGAILAGKRELKLNSSTKQPRKRRISVSRADLSATPTVSKIKRRTALKSNLETVRGEAALLPIDLREKKMKLPIKGGNNTSKGTSRESGVLANGLVGHRIKVWRPLDEMFYHGRIQFYDPITKKHKVLYEDGDRETLNLEKEWWEFIEDDLPDEHQQMADNPRPITSPVILRKQNGNDGSSQSMRILNYKKYVNRAGADTRLQEVEEAPNLGNQNIGGDESSDDESTEDNVFEFRARSKDVLLEIPSASTSDDSIPKASPPSAIRVGSKDLQLDNPRPITSTVILRKQNGNDGSFQSTRILNYKKYIKRAGADTRLQEVKEAPNLGNQNIGGDESSNDESTEDNVFEFRARSKDVQLENPSASTSDDSTPEASPPRVIRVGSKDLQLENPGTSTSDDSTPEASPLRYIRARSKDVRLQSTSNDSTPEASLPRYIRVKSKNVRLQSTSDDSTPEGSPPRPWGLWRSRHH